VRPRRYADARAAPVVRPARGHLELEHRAAGIAGEHRLEAERLAELADQLTAATSDRIQKEVLYNELKSGDADSTTVVMSNSIILAFRKDLSALESEYNQNLKTYKPDYPKMVKLHELIEQLRKKMETETKRVVASEIGRASCRERV